MVRNLPLIHPRRAHAEIRFLVEPDFPRLTIIRPVRESGDNRNAVVSLTFSEAHVILESGFRSDGTFAIVVGPMETIGDRRIPGVADEQERGAVGILECVAVGRRLDESAAKGVGVLFSI